MEDPLVGHKRRWTARTKLLACRRHPSTPDCCPDRRTPTTRLTSAASRRDDAALRPIFCDLHGSRLHGFALLVSLGDARRAERATGDALAVGSQHAAALSHPERAAAWLRARVFRRLQHASLLPGSPSSSARRAELAKLGVDDATFDGLASLSLAGRAAVAATMIERFAPMDVETILGTSSSAARRLAARASSDFLAAVASRHVSSEAGPAGELARRVGDVADRAIASTPAPRAP